MSVEITIDNHKILAKPEETILDVANENSIHIPTLCNHPNLKPTGACRICVVDIGRADRLEAACTTPVSPKMTVFTANERVKRARRTTLELIISNLTADVRSLDKEGTNVLLDLAKELGVDIEHLRFTPSKEEKTTTPLDDANPVVHRNRDNCIICGRCVSACNELKHYGVLNFEGRGFRTNIVSGLVQPLLDSGCASCGACIEVCPTGAFKALPRELVQPEVDAVIETGLSFPVSATTQSMRAKLGLPPLDETKVAELSKIAKHTNLKCKTMEVRQ
jgi:formate dehydrogenase alpha subunit